MKRKLSYSAHAMIEQIKACCASNTYSYMVVYISVTKRQLSFEFEYVIVFSAIVSVLLVYIQSWICMLDRCMHVQQIANDDVPDLQYCFFFKIRLPGYIINKELEEYNFITSASCAACRSRGVRRPENSS